MGLSVKLNPHVLSLYCLQSFQVCAVILFLRGFLSECPRKHINTFIGIEKVSPTFSNRKSPL